MVDYIGRIGKITENSHKFEDLLKNAIQCLSYISPKSQLIIDLNDTIWFLVESRKDLDALVGNLVAEEVKKSGEETNNMIRSSIAVIQSVNQTPQ